MQITLGAQGLVAGVSGSLLRSTLLLKIHHC
jgi:hypothetical protein